MGEGGDFALEGLVDVIGPVKVTVPNDDLEEYEKGSVVEINASNVDRFLHYRDTSRDFSNEGRMERQKAYIMAAADQIFLPCGVSPVTVVKGDDIPD